MNFRDEIKHKKRYILTYVWKSIVIEIQLKMFMENEKVTFIII